MATIEANSVALRKCIRPQNLVDNLKLQNSSVKSSAEFQVQLLPPSQLKV